MGLDSVEIILCWEESLDIDIPDERLSQLTTPMESFNYLSELVGSKAVSGPSFIIRAFNSVREILITEFGIERSRIKLTSKLGSLFPKKNRRRCWAKFKRLLETDNLSVTLGWPLFGPSGTTVENVVIELVARKSYLMKKPQEAWHSNQIREIVRCSVTYVVGIKQFSDNAKYIGEIGID